MYDTIVVGTDGSASASDAVERALALAGHTGGDLHAITVVNTRRYGEPALGSTELVLNELESRANEQLMQIRDEASRRDLDVVTKHFHGDPSEEIVRYADAVDADVIVLGFRGRTHSRAHIGSTADRVARTADRAVLLV